MMRRLGWIRVFGLLCAGVCAVPLLGQNPPNHKSGSNAGTVSRQQPSPAAQRQAPAASAPKTANTNVQKQPQGGQPQPAAGTVKPSTSVSTRPIPGVRPNVSPATVPAQTSIPAQTQPAQTSTPGMYTHPITNGQTNGTTSAPVQSVPAQTPSLYVDKPAQSLQPKVTPTQTYTPVQTPPIGRTSPSGTTGNPGTSDGPPATSPPASTSTEPPYTKYNPKPSDGNGKGPATPGTKSSSGDSKGGAKGDANHNQPSSDGNANGSRTTGPKPPPAPAPTPPPPIETHKQPPPHVPPRRPHAPVPEWPLPPIQTFPSSGIPSGQMFPPRGNEPSPPSRVMPTPPESGVQAAVPSPAPGVPSSPSPAQPGGNGQQSQPPATNTPTATAANTPTATAAPPTAPRPRAESSAPGVGKVVGGIESLTKTDPILPALTLTPKTRRPVVGKDVVVVAALEPALSGASYRLNWGDGSPAETVSGSGQGTHHYAKAKLYKVSASTVVGDSHLNHEILLQVGPVAPRIDWLLAALAGLAALFLHFPPVPKVTASFRWGAPGVPQMTLLNREPYLSLSFEPGVGPAEEDITFSKK